MKKMLFCALSLYISLSLEAQTLQDISIFVPPVTGAGSGPDEVNGVFPVLVFSMLANIPMSKMVWSDIWRHKWWYFSGYAYWTPRVYVGSALSSNLANFGFGVATELHFLNGRFVMDIGKSGLDKKLDNDVHQYQRYVVKLAIWNFSEKKIRTGASSWQRPS